MLLHELVYRFDPQSDLTGIPDVPVLAVQEDSRMVSPGTLFVARGGTRTDGSKYVADAKARGAVAVITETRLDACPLPQIVVSSAAFAVSVLAHILQNRPSHAMKVLGVTGTNGKTTTAYLIRHILAKAGKRCGMIGTVEIDDGWRKYEATMTTPGAVEVVDLLSTMRAAECDACAIEVSSHSLDQHRVAGVRFAGAGFSNLTGDHLDYHKTMQNYASAKAKLFEILSEDAVACINAESVASDRMVRDCPARIIRFGFGPDVDYRATDIAITAHGSHFILVTPDGRTEVSMNLIGRHNIENALMAGALCSEVFGLSVHQIAGGLKDAAGAPGRLQVVRAGQPFALLVDYAHTDDALQNVLSSLRPLTRGKLRVLFGCGGDRDPSKRARMAKVAQRLADEIHVTSDNPRTENPQKILDDIVSGFIADNEKSIHVEIDRRKAIERIVGDAEANDVVLLAGKGHENYQIVGKTKHHFDDVEEASNAVAMVLQGRRY